MAITFSCECGQKLKAQDADVGRSVRCPQCGQESEVPAPGDDAVQAAEALPTAPARRGDGDRVRRGRDRSDEASDRPARSRTRDWGDDDEEEGQERHSGETKTSGKAVAALVLGLLSFVLCIFSGIPAMIYGFLGMRDVSRSRGRLKGQGLAIAGIALGAIGMLMAIPLILLGLLLPAVQKVREAAVRMQGANNLHQMGLAMHNYHSTHGTFPTDAAISDKNGKPLLSWRVAILPYIEQDGLYRQFKLDEPWDSPHNSRLVTQMPPIFADMNNPTEWQQGLTHYRVFVGPKTAFEPGKPAGLGLITDGTSNTVMVVETADAVPWTKPDEIVYDPKGPLPKFSTRIPSGVNVLMFDGSVRTVRQQGVSEQSWRNAITAKGGEFPGPDW